MQRLLSLGRNAALCSLIPRENSWEQVPRMAHGYTSWHACLARSSAPREGHPRRQRNDPATTPYPDADDAGSPNAERLNADTLPYLFLPRD